MGSKDEDETDKLLDLWGKSLPDISKICYKRIKRNGKWTRCSRPKGHPWWQGHK